MRSPIVQLVLRPPAKWAQIGGPLDPTPETHQTVEALIDTGAAQTMVDHVVVDRLRLPRVGCVTLRGFGSPERHAPTADLEAVTYLAELDLQGRRIGVTAAAVNLYSGLGVKVVLGMDALEHFVLTLNGPAGTFSLR